MADDEEVAAPEVVEEVEMSVLDALKEVSFEIALPLLLFSCFGYWYY